MQRQATRTFQYTELCYILRLGYLTYNILCDSFAQKVLGNREKKRIVLEILYHAELEGKQPTKCQHWNVNGFHKYLTHTAGTSRCFPAFAGTHII